MPWVPLGRAVATKRKEKKLKVPSFQTIARVDPDKARPSTACRVVDEEEDVVVIADVMIMAVDAAVIGGAMTAGMIVEDAITTKTAASEDVITTRTIANFIPWKVDAVVVEDVDVDETAVAVAVDEAMMVWENGNVTTMVMADMTTDMTTDMVRTKTRATATTTDMAVATIITDEVMDMVVAGEAALADVVVAEAAVVEEAQQVEEKLVTTMLKPLVVVRMMPPPGKEVKELLTLLDTHLPWYKQTIADGVDSAVAVLVVVAFIEEVVAAAVVGPMWST